MQCPSCKARLQPNVRFCGICGHKLPLGKSGFAQEDEGATEIDTGQRFVVDADVDPFVGMVLNNRFIVEQKLGEGGFGAVYRGTQTGTGRKVAIKLLHPDMTRDENLVARFRREGLVLCNLRDAHTVTTYDFDQTPDGTLYIAMELLEGKSLHEIFQEQAPLDWQRMFKILTEMCSSLAEAHAQGIVHRDLKPENIYLEERPGHPDFVKILDFGIAKVMRGDTLGGGKAAQLTATGQTLGTLEYMSPEQLMGKTLDGRSDVYALGVLAYEMMTTQLPFPDAKGPAGLITAQLRQEPRPPSAVNPGFNIPPAADQVILKMLAKTQDGRFADVSALRDACNQVLAQVGQGGRAGSNADSSFAQAAPAGDSMAHAQQQAHPGGPQSARPLSSPPPMTLATMPASQQAPMQQAAMQQAPMQQAAMQQAPMQQAAMQQAAMQQAAMQQQYGQPSYGSHAQYSPASYTPPGAQGSANSRLWLWIALALVALGGVVGTVLVLAT